MKKLSFDEFAVQMYHKSVKQILISLLRSKELGKDFYGRSLKDQKEIESFLDKKALEISKEFVKRLKKKGFPKKELSDEEQQKMLGEVINEFVSK